MATIIIERIKEHTHWPYQYAICINDVNVESIGNDEAKEVTVPAGAHSIYIRKVSSRSEALSFEINENEAKTFRVSVAESVKVVNAVGGILFLVMACSVSFVRNNGPSIIMVFFILIITLIAYSFSLQNKHFSLVEIVQ